MIRVGLTAKSASPVVTGRRSVYGHFIQSHDYIPGGALRGALAAAVLRTCPQCKAAPDQGPCGESQCPLHDGGRCLFRTVFIGDEAVIFTSLYPGDPRAEGRAVFATPLSMHTCKRCPGGQRQQAIRRRDDPFAETEPDAHGWSDLLLQAVTRCPVCDEDLAPATEAFFGLLNGGGIGTLTPARTVQTHVSLDPRYNTAQEGALYSVDALERDQTFEGGLVIRDGMPATPLEKLVNRYAHDTLPVGGGGSRGLGAVRLTWREQPDSLKESVAERLEAFQGGTSENKLRFALLLQDDAILLDPQTRAPVVGLQPEVVRAALGAALLPNLQSVTLLARSAVISGWNSRWKMPKWNALATLKGAVGLYEIDAPAATERAALVAALEKLELDGLGERRAEGLGQVVVCHPVHREGFANGQ